MHSCNITWPHWLRRQARAVERMPKRGLPQLRRCGTIPALCTCQHSNKPEATGFKVFTFQKSSDPVEIQKYRYFRHRDSSVPLELDWRVQGTIRDLEKYGKKMVKQGNWDKTGWRSGGRLLCFCSML